MVKCENESCSREATIICHECGYIMCEECSRTVHEIEPSHKPKPYRPNYEEVTIRCNKHGDKLVYYIESREKAVCARCLIDDYPGEKWRPINEVSNEKKKKLEGHKEDLDEVKKRLGGSLKYLKDEKKKEEENEIESLKAVKEWGDATIRMIRKICSEHETIIKEYHLEVKNDLRKKIEETDNVIKEFGAEISKVKKDIETWNDQTGVNHLDNFGSLIDEGEKLIQKGNIVNDEAEGTETRATYFKASTQEEGIRQTTRVDKVETPNNIPRVKSIDVLDANCTNIRISWSPIEKIPEKLAKETLDYSVALFNDADTSNPICVTSVGENTSFKIDGLIPGMTYKVAVKTAFGNDPKHVSQSKFVDLKTKDVLDPPEEIVVQPQVHKVYVSWEVPRCLDGRSELIKNVSYQVSIMLDGEDSKPIANNFPKEPNTFFDNLEEEKSYRIKVSCKYGNSEKFSAATEKAFRTSNMVATEYFSRFRENPTIKITEGCRFTPAVEDGKGIGILSDIIGEDKCVKVSFLVKKDVKPKVGIIPKEVFNDGTIITNEKAMTNSSLSFTCVTSNFLLCGVSLSGSKKSIDKLDVSSDYILTLEINTHSRRVKAYHNGNLACEGTIPKKSPEKPDYGVDVYPFIISSEEITLVSSKGELPQQLQSPPSPTQQRQPSPPQQQRQPSPTQQRQPSPTQQRQPSPTQQSQAVSYQEQWFQNNFLRPLEQKFSVQKIGGENLYGAMAIGSKPLEQSLYYTFKVMLSPGDRHVRIGLVHPTALKSNDLNDPRIFSNMGVVYIDLFENCIVANNARASNTNSVNNGSQGVFHICMSIFTKSGRIVFDFFETELVRLGSIDLNSNLSGFYPFVALSGNNSVTLEN